MQLKYFSEYKFVRKPMHHLSFESWYLNPFGQNNSSGNLWGTQYVNDNSRLINAATDLLNPATDLLYPASDI